MKCVDRTPLGCHIMWLAIALGVSPSPLLALPGWLSRPRFSSALVRTLSPRRVWDSDGASGCRLRRLEPPVRDSRRVRSPPPFRELSLSTRVRDRSGAAPEAALGANRLPSASEPEPGVVGVLSPPALGPKGGRSIRRVFDRTGFCPR